MTTKTASSEHSTPAGKATPLPQQDVQVAYRVHTLVHLLYGQMVANHPWMVVPPHYATCDPRTGPTVTPGAGWPAMWGPTIGWPH